MRPVPLSPVYAYYYNYYNCILVLHILVMTPFLSLRIKVIWYYG